MTPDSPTLLTIDLGAIADNYRLLAARSAPARVAAAVKADAYGLGLAPVATALWAAGCRTFFVATIDEGVALRKVLDAVASTERPDFPHTSRRSQGAAPQHEENLMRPHPEEARPNPLHPHPEEARRAVSKGPRTLSQRAPDEAEICVLNGLIAGPAALFREHRLLPVLNDLGQIEGWQRFCRETGSLPAAVHVDTGMSRLGLPPSEFDILAAEPDRLDGIDCRYLMSHLACAEDPENPMNAAQRDAFADAVSRLPGPTASLANSSGIFLGPGWHFDLTRPGAALYGLAPQTGQPNPMKPVVRLEAKILQIRDVDTPRTVGYGAAHRVTGPTRVATVGVGYADGYLRSLSGRGESDGGGAAWIDDIAVPVIGRVSMDLITLDVTRLPEARPGTMVELIGPHHDVDALARAAGTIGYEILTGLGRRYRRRYAGGEARP